MGKHQDPLEERGKSEELKPQLQDKLSPTLYPYLCLLSATIHFMQ